ncbi:glucose-6-phosphate dehydrogenase [Pseudactinotalea sp. HY160]|uniref:glucose-6-phosphate dehydrogenase n=1 Tax=Pseudactinotalea sp. HY160 TaxID=2654490 RepID=UPI00128DBAA0|nr:glucose-6-phosphate dehydrogenase [Pseudactinotalea sp. HY160]MPV50614.1 glucose-6-phosphate dehydrogenase [Pseudactinotalea sp. HY160]
MTTPTTLLVLGASGDLTRRLLLPGLGSLLERDPDRPLRIVGADRADLGADGFADRLGEALAEGGASDAVLARHRESDYHRLDVTDADAFARVLADVAGDANERLVLYFALPPAVTERACHALTHCDLPADTHLAMEKPFGRDQESARALNELVARLVPDERVHRVDHFLGKSTVIDVMALRFANRMTQAVWSADHIAAIEIAYDEALALEGRAGYYDHAGALVDMIQSHLLQVMAVVAMEPPSQITGRELRDAKSAVLRATRLWGGDAATASRRGRYTAGTIGERHVPNYLDETGVDPARDTETMAQVTVEVVNQRWRGVPITLRSGKALGHTHKQIVITFEDVRHLPEGFRGADTRDRLIIGLDPDVMELRLTTNGTEDPFELEQSTFATELRRAELTAYGEVLAAILDGEAMLSVRGDAAEECWRLTDEVLAAWKAGTVPMEDYEAGSPVPGDWGPALG